MAHLVPPAKPGETVPHNPPRAHHAKILPCSALLRAEYVRHPITKYRVVWRRIQPCATGQAHHSKPETSALNPKPYSLNQVGARQQNIVLSGSGVEYVESEGSAHDVECIRAPLAQHLWEGEAKRSSFHLKMAGAEHATSRAREIER